MRIDGRAIAQKLLDKLRGEIKTLNVTPTIAVVVVGEEPVWQAYVRQKLLKGEEIGAKVIVSRHPVNISNQKLLKIVQDFNNDQNIHGIIVQRPLPSQIDRQALSLAISPKKDVDGFHPESLHPMPVAEAVMRILKEVYKIADGGAKSFNNWLHSNSIVVIGKGETAGQPVINALQKLGATPEIIDSKTPNPEIVTKTADVIISCVGKPEIIKPADIKKGAILIGVGLHKDEGGKLHTDYDEEKIKDIAAFYTPAPGGVGPVNVACLLENLVKACYSQKSS